MWDALAVMSTGKLIALGVLGFIVLIVVSAAIVALAAILGPGIFAGPGRVGTGRWSGGAPRETPQQRPPMPISVRVLGFGIVFVAVGLGIVLSLLIAPAAGFWGAAGAVVLCAGLGLIVFYVMAEKAEKAERERQLMTPSAEPTETD